jgi:hypothetical protein
MIQPVALSPLATPVGMLSPSANPSSLTFTDSIWSIFSTLLDGPATAQAIADRTGLSLARVHRDLSSLHREAFIEEDGGVRYGAFLERRYRLPKEAKALNGDLQSLRYALEVVEQGLHGAQKRRQSSIAGLTGVRVSEETARWAIQESLKHRQYLETLEIEDGPIKLYVFNSAWMEEICTP